MELRSAHQRSEATRAEQPLLDVVDFANFIDGSSLGDHHDLPNEERLWEVCYIRGKVYYLYESTDMPNLVDGPNRVSLKVWSDSDGKYRGVGLDDLTDEEEWPIDTLIRVRKRLRHFYTRKDLAKRVKKFTDELRHPAAAAYLSA